MGTIYIKYRTTVCVWQLSPPKWARNINTQHVTSPINGLFKFRRSDMVQDTGFMAVGKSMPPESYFPQP